MNLPYGEAFNNSTIVASDLCVILPGDKKLQLHKFMVYTRSPLLRQVHLSEPSNELDCRTSPPMNRIEAEVLEPLFKYLYTNTLEIEDRLLPHFVAGLNLLEIEYDAIAYCSNLE